tara:strand:+ start:343 stop:597 length:255 start_codon:yes stop_codon:yes gene_type:complete
MNKFAESINNPLASIWASSFSVRSGKLSRGCADASEMNQIKKAIATERFFTKLYNNNGERTKRALLTEKCETPFEITNHGYIHY